jgi:flagellin-like protein
MQAIQAGLKRIKLKIFLQVTKMLTKVDRIGKDDRALSAIVGVVLVLAVTVVAGLALYMWWNSMQSTSQSTVGEQTKAQIGQMIRERERFQSGR